MSPLGNRSKPEYRRREAAQTSTARRSRLKHYQGNMAGTSGGHLGADEVEVGSVDKTIVRKQDGTKTKTPRHYIQSMIVLPRAVAPTLGASVLSHMLKRERQNTLRLRLHSYSSFNHCSLNLLSLTRSRLSEHVHGPAKVHGPAHVVAAESPTPRIARSSSCRPPEASRTPPRTRGSPVPLVSLVESEHSCPPDPMFMVLRITSPRGRRGN